MPKVFLKKMVAVGDLVGETEPSDSSVNVTHNAVLETLGTGLFRPEARSVSAGRIRCLRNF